MTTLRRYRRARIAAPFLLDGFCFSPSPAKCRVWTNCNAVHAVFNYGRPVVPRFSRTRFFYYVKNGLEIEFANRQSATVRFRALRDIIEDTAVLERLKKGSVPSVNMPFYFDQTDPAAS